MVIDVEGCLEKTRTFGVHRDLVRQTTRDHLFLIWTFPGADPLRPPATPANQPRPRSPPHRSLFFVTVQLTRVRLRSSLTAVSVSASRVCVSFRNTVPSGVATGTVPSTLGVAAETRHGFFFFFLLSFVPVYSYRYGTKQGV